MTDRAREVIAREMTAALYPLMTQGATNELVPDTPCFEHADAIIAALAAAGLIIEEGWRPIESAPKDGTVVQVIDATVPEPMAIVAHWAQHDAWSESPAWLCGTPWPAVWKMTPRMRRAYSEFVGEVMSPTHWRPLPALPSPVKQEG